MRIWLLVHKDVDTANEYEEITSGNLFNDEED